ncbi:MAG: hypothetical protein AAF570_10135, partial [Bacteroidota bacterium]
IYDLEIRVLDDCGNDVLAGGKITETVGGTDLNTVCATTLFELDASGGLTATLDVGKYTAIKSLKVNAAALDYYTEQYLGNNNSCLKTLDDFVTEEIANIDTTGCNVSCATCDDPPTGWSTNNFFQQECAQLCDNDWCSAYYYGMLSDLQIGGQYAGLNGYTAADDINMFSTSTCLQKWENGSLSNVTDKWTDPCSPYLNADGSASLINGVAPENLSKQDFIDNWRPSWAASLLCYHPEYCYYEFCGTLTTEHDYAESLLNVADYATANSSGYLDSLTDPLYTRLQVAGQSSAYHSAWDNFLHGATSNYDLNEAAHIVHNCPNSPGTCTGTLAVDTDQEWLTFRDLYISFRTEMIDVLFESESSNPCVSRVALPGGTGICGSGNWADKAPVHVELDNVNGVDYTGNGATTQTNIANLANQNIAVHCSTTCASFVTAWEIQFEDCLDAYDNYAQTTLGWTQAQIDAFHAGFFPDLEGVCNAGCDVDNPMGASNAAPAQQHFSTYLNQNVTSFAQVVNLYFGTFGTDGTCSELLISMPMAYGHGVPFVDTECEQPGDTLHHAEFDPGNFLDAQHNLFSYIDGLEARPTSNCNSIISENNPSYCTSSGCVGPEYDMSCTQLAGGTTYNSANGLWSITDDASNFYNTEFPVTGTGVFSSDPSQYENFFLAIRGEYALNGASSGFYSTYGNPQNTPVAGSLPWTAYMWGPTVTPSKTYEISFWAINLWGDTQDKDFLTNRYDPSLDVQVTAFNGTTSIGSSVLGTRILPKNPGQWQKISFTWQAPANSTSAQFRIRNYMVSRAGNDFGIDRVIIRELESDCCKECDEFNVELSTFLTNTGFNVNTTPNFWTLFATHANDVFNFSLSEGNYADFYASCNSWSGNPPVVIDPKIVSLPDPYSSMRAVPKDTFFNING